MKFIKNTLLKSTKSLNINALSLNNQSSQEPKPKQLQQELHKEYEQLKSTLANIKHRPKYQALLESFQGLLDVKDSLINKKLENLMTTLYLTGGAKKKQKQIPLLEAFLDFSIVERYKFLIDIIKNVEQHQKTVQKANIDSQNPGPSKKKDQIYVESRTKIFSEASISLNELKKMSLSYWTKVSFELNCKTRELKVSGKQSFMLYLENYLVRLSKNQKNCFVLLCCNPEQVPNWLRKVYVQIKKEIFVEVFQGIWNEIIQIQLQKMQASFEQVQKQKQQSPTKSICSNNEEQIQIQKQGYSVFLTPQALRTYMSQKTRFTTKIKNKLKFSLYKEIDFNGSEFQSIRQKLSKISLLKAFDEKNKQIYQAKGSFNLPASVAKFKFIDSLRKRNKFIRSWEILQNESGKNLQAISQSYDFSELFQNEAIQLDSKVYEFKQLSLIQEATDYGNNEIPQIFFSQSIKEISKSLVMNFLMIQCEKRKDEKSQLIVTCEFNKHLIKRKMQKLKIDSVSKDKIVEMNKKLVQNFMKEMILMIFTQQESYEVTRVQSDQEFFTICEAFDNDMEELELQSSKSIINEEEVQEIQFNHKDLDQISIDSDEKPQIKLKKTNKVFSFGKCENAQEPQNQPEKKIQSLNFIKQQSLDPKKIFSEKLVKVDLENSTSYLKAVFLTNPQQKNTKPYLVKRNLLADEWLRLEEGGLTCINEAKIKEQKQIIKKILVKLGETILKQKNIMHVSLPKPTDNGSSRAVLLTFAFRVKVLQYQLHDFVYDSTNNLLALFTYGPTKKGLFSSSSEPSDYLKGRITKMSESFRSFEFFKWKKSDYTLKKQWIQNQVSSFEGIWSKKVFFNGEEYFNFDTQLPFELVPELNPLPSDSKFRDDLKWLIKGDLEKSQEHKERMQEQQRYDKKLRTTKKH